VSSSALGRGLFGGSTHDCNAKSKLEDT
jgi:hypothetical protein